MGDFVDDLACVLKHAKIAGKPVCVGLVRRFPWVGLCLDTLTHLAVLDTTGAVLSAGRLDVLAPTFSRVLSPSLLLYVVVFPESGSNNSR